MKEGLTTVAKGIETCEILTCGTEILMGQIINTNAAYLAAEVALLGISSLYQTTVGDNMERLVAALKTALSRSDCVILTGGLGPTEDDISMAAAALTAGVELAFHEPSARAIRQYFAAIGREPAKNNFKQAMLPVGATVLPNHNGTAPGAIVSVPPADGREYTGYIILLPGPPLENRMMFESSVKDFLQSRTTAKLTSTFVRMIGIGESDATTILADLIEQQQNPTLAPYASEGEVAFRITQRTVGAEEPAAIELLLDELKNRLGSYIYEIGNRSLPAVLKDLLTEQQKKICFAESCTAGLVAATFADQPGASVCLQGGVVAYANSVKEAALSVPAAMLAEHGAVSEQVAMAMAKGCLALCGADVAVSITGIAGPGGGSEEKPVGTVYIGVATADSCSAKHFYFRGNRQKIRKIACLNAFNEARLELLKNQNSPFSDEV